MRRTSFGTRSRERLLEDLRALDLRRRGSTSPSDVDGDGDDQGRYRNDGDHVEHGHGRHATTLCRFSLMHGAETGLGEGGWRRLRASAAISAGVVAAIVLLVTVAFAVDAVTTRGEVRRNVSIAGRPAGGMDAREVTGLVREASSELARATVQVRTAGADVRIPVADLRVRVREEATAAAVLRTGRTGSSPGRVLRWAASFVRDDRAAVLVDLDASAAWDAVARHDGRWRPPEEPRIRGVPSGFDVVRGTNGSGIDPRHLLAELPAAVRDGPPLDVAVPRGPVPPRYPLRAAQRLVPRAEEIVRAGLRVRGGAAESPVADLSLRPWITSRPGPSGLELDVDAARVLADLSGFLASARQPPTETTFTVTDGRVEIVAGRNGAECCDVRAGEVVRSALLRSRRDSVEVPLRPVEPRLTAAGAERLAIREPVASFTTTFAAGQPRVRNIHRIADLVRGRVILPNEAFSINGFVGERTTDKGFVPAPVIEEGMFTEDVGGGISQFATTLFNAAFFAGLEFEEYQSHSIYISRYPYGREATLAFPKPDLRVKNSSPHGILIWPTYTPSSITVTLYSTKFVDVEQTAQARTPAGACTRVRTERTRRYLDGRTDIDAVFATYRPREGVNC